MKPFIEERLLHLEIVQRKVGHCARVVDYSRSSTYENNDNGTNFVVSRNNAYTTFVICLGVIIL